VRRRDRRGLAGSKLTVTISKSRAGSSASVQATVIALSTRLQSIGQSTEAKAITTGLPPSIGKAQPVPLIQSTSSST
jgi:hypothetical protein